jgi:hypothetical protein
LLYLAPVTRFQVAASCLRLGLACAAACGGVTPHRSIEVASGAGKATIDGTLSPGEWSGATTLNVVINLPAGGGTLAKLLVMNDATDLYLAFSFDGSFSGNSLSFEFDVDGNNKLSVGDDGIVFNPSVGFIDVVRTMAPPCPSPGLCSFPDSDLGGTTDGAGAFRSDGTTTVYELRHPLKSGDRDDVALVRGDTIGVQMSISLQDSAIARTEFPGPSAFFGLTIR